MDDIKIKDVRIEYETTIWCCDFENMKPKIIMTIENPTDDNIKNEITKCRNYLAAERKIIHKLVNKNIKKKKQNGTIYN